jgi:hypothetical protein
MVNGNGTDALYRKLALTFRNTLEGTAQAAENIAQNRLTARIISSFDGPKIENHYY